MQRSPTRGEDAANAAGEGTADETHSVPSFPPPCRHSCVGRNPYRAPQRHRRGAPRPVSLYPPRPTSFPRKREPTGEPSFPRKREPTGRTAIPAQSPSPHPRQTPLAPSASLPLRYPYDLAPQPQRRTGAPDGRRLILHHFRLKQPQKRLKQPQRRRAANLPLGVNESK